VDLDFDAQLLAECHDLSLDAVAPPHETIRRRSLIGVRARRASPTQH
jgi:hypothetical protein